LENVTAGYPPGQMFLLESQKGSRKLDRPPCKRGGRAQRRGMSRELDCILVARDRSGQAIDAVTGRGALSAAQLTQQAPPTKRQHLSRAFAPVAGAISRRGIALSAELSVLALGARHGPNCYHRTIVQHRIQTHLYETVTAPRKA